MNKQLNYFKFCRTASIDEFVDESVMTACWPDHAVYSYAHVAYDIFMTVVLALFT
jgi:hypothetical protein